MTGLPFDPVAIADFDVRPPQLHRGVRLVPLCARRRDEDLRAASWRTGHDLTAVHVKEGMYVSRIPYSVVLSYTRDGSPVVRQDKPGGAPPPGDPHAWRTWLGTLGLLRGVARRLPPEGPGSPEATRVLPLHMAMAGLLSTCFSGPTVRWPEYSDETLRYGLRLREEKALPGRAVPGMEDALRVFEVLEEQVGMLIFLGDTFASAFVAPHPDDYRPLHHLLLEDFYQRNLYWLALYVDAAPWNLTFDGEVGSYADLRASLARAHQAWGEGALQASGDVRRPWTLEGRHEAGPFTLYRFHTGYEPGFEHHMGECVLRPDGRLGWLKTFRMAEDQAARAWLLLSLRDHDWNVEQAAEALGSTAKELVRRLHAVGLGGMFKPEVVRAARAGQGAHGGR